MNRLASILGRFTVTLAAVAVAVAVGWQIWVYYMDAPWTRDGRVRADVVAIAPDVSGLVTDVSVRDNQKVSRGDVLFRIDRQRFALALAQAEAVVAGRKAALDIASADLGRYKQLSDNVVSKEKLEQATATQQQAVAASQQSMADRDIAKLNLERSEVRASVNGVITNMELQPGEYVTAGKGVMALVDTDSLHVEGYFEETKLPRIHVGDPAAVKLLGESGTLAGHVESIAGGIEDRERSSGSNLLANVNPSFTWVRLAQRVPVRIKLDAPPPDGRILTGRTATVVIDPGAWMVADGLDARLRQALDGLTHPDRRRLKVVKAKPAPWASKRRGGQYGRSRRGLSASRRARTGTGCRQRPPRRPRGARDHP